MPGFDELAVGVRVSSPGARIDAEQIRMLIAATGYVHPLFTDPDHARASPFDTTPLPGQLVLAIMGGQTEQTGLLDHSVVALVGLDQARFHTPVTAGDEVTTTVEVLAMEPSKSGTHGTVRLLQRSANQRGEPVAEAVATLLLRR